MTASFNKSLCVGLKNEKVLLFRLHLLARQKSGNRLKIILPDQKILLRSEAKRLIIVSEMSQSVTETPNITQMLREWGDGNAEAMEELLPYIYSELHRQAAAFLRRERGNHTLQTTALVHEAYLKLVDQRNVEWQSRSHFFAIASQAMRRILVDYAKNRHREKRGGGAEDLSLEEALLATADETNVDLIALDEALSKLAELDPQQEKIVELRYFGGLSLDEAAVAIGISRATAARDWQVAKAWLHREMTR
jgi:RNA polymerase sigma factor (TIGR02999 family)